MCFLLNVYLYCLYCVLCIFPFMYIYSPLFCLYWCKDCCHRVTTELQLVFAISNNNNNKNNTHLLAGYIWCAIQIQTCTCQQVTFGVQYTFKQALGSRLHLVCNTQSNQHLLAVYIWCAIHIQTISSNITHLQRVLTAATDNPSHQLTKHESSQRHGRIDPIRTVTFQSPAGQTTFTHFQQQRPRYPSLSKLSTVTN